MNDEVPDEGDYDAGRGHGEFDNITPEDFIHGGGSGHGNPPGWLGPADINRARHQMPIAYVEIVPVRTDDDGPHLPGGLAAARIRWTGRSNAR